MKYIMLLYITTLSLTALAQKDNIIIKDRKPLETFFKDSSKYKNLSYGKYISNITIAGRMERTPFINKVGKAKGNEWIITLFDGTRVYIGLENIDNHSIENLYKHTVQIKGSILDGSIDIYSQNPRYAQSRGGYRIDAETISDISLNALEDKVDLEMIRSSTSKKAMLKGILKKRNFVTKNHIVAEQEWIITLKDSTIVLLGKQNLNQFKLEHLYNKEVEATGFIKYGSIDIYTEDGKDAQSRGGYRIDVQEINVAVVKSAIVLDFSGIKINTDNLLDRRIENKNSTPLILKISDIKGGLGMGYGFIYIGKVDKVIKGNLNDTTIRITILASDAKKFPLIGQFKQPIIIRFNKSQENEPYNFAMINGFVDSHKTSWKIVEVQPSN